MVSKQHRFLLNNIIEAIYAESRTLSLLNDIENNSLMVWNNDDWAIWLD